MRLPVDGHDWGPIPSHQSDLDWLMCRDCGQVASTLEVKLGCLGIEPCVLEGEGVVVSV